MTRDKRNFLKYSDLVSLASLVKGLERLKSSVLPGVDYQISKAFTNETLAVLHKQLISQKYVPRPIKRVNIPTADGSKRPFAIASQRDKIIQAAILNHLEPIFENFFLVNSFGSRPKKNCHDALKEIKLNWQNINWVIDINIAKHFGKLQHPLLLTMLREYCDQPTTELISKFLKSGYIDISCLANSLERSSEGIPPSAIISPNLANLFFHKLDLFIVKKLLTKWNCDNFTIAELDFIKKPSFRGAKKVISQ